MHDESELSSVRSSTTLFYECEESKTSQPEFVIGVTKQASVCPYTKSIMKVKETFKNKLLSPIEKLIEVKDVI